MILDPNRFETWFDVVVVVLSTVTVLTEFEIVVVFAAVTVVAEVVAIALSQTFDSLRTLFTWIRSW